MKIKFINILPPSAVQWTVNEPMLGTPIVAGLTPENIDVEIQDVVKNQEFTIDSTVDLVAISAITNTSIFAYKIAQKYKEIGKKVVMGGIHVSILPDEALKYCDSVVVGEAELIWKSVVNDFIEGKLKPMYKATSYCSMDVVPNARLDLINSKNYVSRAVIHASRGCPYNCSFCSVTKFYGNTYRMRPVNKVIEEIEHMRSNGTCSNFIFFSDDNMACTKKYTKTLLNELKRLDISWGTQCNLNIANDKELLQLFQSSKCVYLFVGIETISSDNAKSIKKSMNDIKKYEDQIKKIKDAGIIIAGSLIVGMDGDDESTFDRTFEFYNKNNIDVPMISIITPFPGTYLFEEWERENRIITKDWSKYDLATVVFEPKLMSPELLQRKYNELTKRLLPRYIEGIIALKSKISKN